jgi:hypothetical protein
MAAKISVCTGYKSDLFGNIHFAILGGLGYGFSVAGGIGLASINAPSQYRSQIMGR